MPGAKRPRDGDGLSADHGGAGGKNPRKGGGERASAAAAEAEAAAAAAAAAASWVRVDGLSAGASEASVAALCRKAGMIRVDLETGAQCVRLLGGGGGTVSALVCYLKPASVSLAVTLLDGLALPAEDGRAACVVAVAPADAPEAPAAVAGAAVSAAARVRAAEQRAALSWAEEGDESIGLRTVVLRNVFDPAEVAGDASGQVADDILEDMAHEAVRYGEVKSLELRSKFGAVTIEYASAGAATAALAAFGGRFFGGRRIAAGFYDGCEFDAKRKDGEGAAAAAAAAPARGSGGVKEADEEARLDDFGAWLEAQ